MGVDAKPPAGAADDDLVDRAAAATPAGRNALNGDQAPAAETIVKDPGDGAAKPDAANAGANGSRRPSGAAGGADRDGPPPGDGAGGAELDPATADLLDRVNPVRHDDASIRREHAKKWQLGSLGTQSNQPRHRGGAAPGESEAPGGARAASDETDAVNLIGPADAGGADAMLDFQAIVRQSVLDEVRDHAGDNADVEVCGVLVGNAYENGAAGLVYIDDLIRGNHSAGRSAAVTFTAETWSHIDREMDAKHSGKRIVGWYHSHPGFGIFLSEMDLFIQKHFFNAAWQTALVYDPHSREQGLFAWRGGKTRRVEFRIDDGTGAQSISPDSVGFGAPPGPASPIDHDPGAEAGWSDSANAGRNSEMLIEKIDGLERRQRWMMTAMAGMALLAIVWPLVTLTTLSNRTQPAPPPATIVVPPAPPLVVVRAGRNGEPSGAGPTTSSAATREVAAIAPAPAPTIRATVPGAAATTPTAATTTAPTGAPGVAPEPAGSAIPATSPGAIAMPAPPPATAPAGPFR